MDRIQANSGVGIKLLELVSSVGTRREPFPVGNGFVVLGRIGRGVCKCVQQKACFPLAVKRFSNDFLGQYFISNKSEKAGQKKSLNVL